jgi:hypothetical protein
VNWNPYMSVGALLGRDAGVGFGPRLVARFGKTNVPYAFQSTLHFGWTLPPPMIKPVGDRVRPYVDIDVRGGVAVPFKASLAHEGGVKPVFGAVAGVGTTF